MSQVRNFKLTKSVISVKLSVAPSPHFSMYLPPPQQRFMINIRCISYLCEARTRSGSRNSLDT